jgi:hypothetical protein
MGASRNFRRSLAAGLSPWTPANSRDFAANYVEVPHFALHLPVESCTIEFWAKFTSFQQNFAFANAGALNGMNRFSSHAPWVDGTLYWDHGDLTKANTQARIDVDASYLLNQWTHFELTVSKERNARAILSNGERLRYFGEYERFVPTDESFFIGGFPGGNLNYPGLLGEVRVWETARTYEQIRATSDRVLAGPQPGLLACWRLDDNVPVGGQILDRSGNNFHGILR